MPPTSRTLTATLSRMSACLLLAACMDSPVEISANENTTVDAGLPSQNSEGEPTSAELGTPWESTDEDAPLPVSDHPTTDAEGMSQEQEAVPGAPPTGGTGIQVRGRSLLVDGQPFHVRAVGWNPVRRGRSQSDGVDYASFADQDIALMKEAGFNAVRTYGLLDDRSVLDRLHAAGIRVINQAYGWGGAPASEVPGRIAAIQDHPAILMWMVGNEWNYNGIYAGLSFEQARERVAEVSRLLKQSDPAHPVATSHGEMPGADTIAALPNVDIWGINTYRGIGFGDLFEVWAQRSDRPLLVSEYGADAYNAMLPGPDEQSQADAVVALTAALRDHGSAYHDDGVCVGGALFEWADEWWKDGNGSVDVHDVGGWAPGGGPHPDYVFNEEWWGIVDIDRNPRAAHRRLSELFASF